MQVVFARKAYGAMHLMGDVEDPVRSLADTSFRRRDLECRFAQRHCLTGARGRAGCRCVFFHCEGELVLDGLEGGQRSGELLAITGIVDGETYHGLDCACHLARAHQRGLVGMILRPAVQWAFRDERSAEVFRDQFRP